jgi:ubiquinone/menaquinone biosynthesis C-methylase UbiE
MKAFNKNKKVWDKIYYEKKAVLDYPNENLVRFVNYLFKEPKGNKVLDLGFGSGNNLIHLLKKGFECYFKADSKEIKSP